SVPDATHAAFVQAVLDAGQIVVAGRGRSGMMGRAFARRLGQMGLRVWGLDDTTVPGRGRSGMMGRAFARRLGQMGLRVWGLDDTTVPRLGAGDLLIACTGSGE